MGNALKTVALFMIAAALFTLSYVVYAVMGKHSRYVPVDYDEGQIIVMDTHTGAVWSTAYEDKEVTHTNILTSNVGGLQSSTKRLPGKINALR